MTPNPTESAEIGNRTLTVGRFGAAEPTIVMLHDGLGSVAQWRSLPGALAQRCGTGVLAYDRSGHGQSTPATPAPADWLHTEAQVLAELLEALKIDNPVLVGHSDGGSIALIHAASGGRCRGVVTLAAHTWVEQICVDKIRAMRTEPEAIVMSLGRYHAEPAKLFDSWSGVWTSSEFQAWDIRPLIADVSCPVLVVQGDQDEYATDDQLTQTGSAIGANAAIMRVEGAGHVIHHEAPEIVAELVANFHTGLGS